ncbi:MAG: peptide-methionine (S)-S-oxide reductase MsrA [Gemmataceae bacterium]|nr:peptide-methionine (S)-S-oxide reductase MsrA [Gemmataceae bacterium]
MDETWELATLGGGCFWCLEAVFEQVDGVHQVVSGYAGGTTEAPTYREVCSGTTGHAEVVQITFDPSRVCYGDLLDIFFATHDPTTLNRQGADVGPQYRSVIFWHSPTQEQTARRKIAEWNASGRWARPIVTEVAPVPRFFPAEEYHQGYFRRHPHEGYCRVVIAPKVAKFRKEFASRLRPDSSGG